MRESLNEINNQIIKNKKIEIELLKEINRNKDLTIKGLKEQLALCSVSNRRELLIDFAMWEIQEEEYQKHVEFLVDGYIKQKGNL